MTDFEARIAAALEAAWRIEWPVEGENFIHPGLVARTFAPRVAAAIEAAYRFNPYGRNTEGVLEALRGVSRNTAVGTE